MLRPILFDQLDHSARQPDAIYLRQQQAEIFLGDVVRNGDRDVVAPANKIIVRLKDVRLMLEGVLLSVWASRLCEDANSWLKGETLLDRDAIEIGVGLATFLTGGDTPLCHLVKHPDWRLIK